LVEVVIVCVITALVAAVALPALSSVNAVRRSAAQRSVERDLGYARERAVCTGRRGWVVFDVAASTYTLLGEPAGNPGRGSAATLTDPATGRPYTRALNAGELAGVTLVSVSFGGGSEVGFDWLGRPLTAAGTPLSVPGVVTISGGGTVTVRPGSGLAVSP
jgi:Tfp pilus assembly protein FimT